AFGIAKAANRITQTQFGMVKGNVRFMSPEQARGDPVDSRSDLFAIGLVIYYALSGDALYTADTAYNLLVKAAQGPGERELANLKGLPKAAQRVLERAPQPPHCSPPPARRRPLRIRGRSRPSIRSSAGTILPSSSRAALWRCCSRPIRRWARRRACSRPRSAG